MPKQKQKTIFVHTMFTICIFLVLGSVINERSVDMLWVGWFKNECFWKRFTCIQSNLAIRNGLIRNKLVLRNHFLLPICHLLHKDKELLALRNNFRATKKFFIAKFDYISLFFLFLTTNFKIWSTNNFLQFLSHPFEKK